MFAGYITMLPDDYENLSQSVIATNGFVNNILSAMTTKNYWDITNEYKPLMHTWYVGVMMHFYLTYPILFFLSKFNKSNPKGILLTLLSTFAVISIIMYFATEDATQRFYYLPFRFFEFAAGGVIALLYNPKKNRTFGKGYVYVCYILLLALIFVDNDVVSPIIRLVVVVALSSVLLCSQDVLENKITGNAILAKIGAASYSIFIWHQVLLAFYRYTITNKFSFSTYAILLVGTVFFSWLSYRYIEQTITKALTSKRTKALFLTIMVAVFIALNAFAGYIYLRAGVVRNVPELDINKNDIHRGMHAEYVDRVNKYNKPFETDKLHWLVIGNSFGRDFVNVILESSVSNQIEVSYLKNDDYINHGDRFRAADMIFFSNSVLNDELLAGVERQCVENNYDPSGLMIVGSKNFGESNGQIYAHRNKDEYFNILTEVENVDRFIYKNKCLQEKYGERYINLMSYVIKNGNKVIVFTPDHHFISADCRHLTKSGAKFFADNITWESYLEKSRNK